MRKVIVTLVDDLDCKSVAAETVSFGLDGVGYEIDLSESNARKFRAGPDKWLSFARRATGRARTAPTTAPDQPEAKAVRK